MASFDFISGDDFRSLLERDYEELSSCVEAKAWKAACVLAGSIVEAVLIDYLIALSYTEQDPLKMDLHHVISACEQESILRAKTVQLSHAIQSYRNLIHPGRSVRLSEEVGDNEALIALKLVEIIIAEVSAHKQRTYGYTAEQIISKLERDPSAVSIMHHLLDSMKPHEIERLLLKVIPEKHYECTSRLQVIREEVDIDPFSAETITTLETFRSSLAECYRLAFDTFASNELKVKAVKQFVRVLKEEDVDRVFAYETALFRAGDLVCLSDKDHGDVRLVKEHLLSRLESEKTNIDIPVLNALSGFGRFIVAPEVTRFVDPIVRGMVLAPDAAQKRVAKKRLEEEYWKTETAVRTKLYNRLSEWVTHFENKGSQERANAVQELMNDLVEEEIPF
jgi:hypothetical protein